MAPSKSYHAKSSFVTIMILLIGGFCSVEGYTIELDSCSPNTYDVDLPYCSSICGDVALAQQICDNSPSCVCSTASPSSVQECVQCHLQLSPQLLTRDGVYNIPLQLDQYTLVCNALVPLNSSTSLAGSNSSTLLPAEFFGLDPDASCLYGLPEVVFLVSAWTTFWKDMKAVVEGFVVTLGLLIILTIICILTCCPIHYRRRPRDTGQAHTPATPATPQYTGSIDILQPQIIISSFEDTDSDDTYCEIKASDLSVRSVTPPLPIHTKEYLSV